MCSEMKNDLTVCVIPMQKKKTRASNLYLKSSILTSSMDALFICLDMQYAFVQITTCKVILFCSPIMLKNNC